MGTPFLSEIRIFSFDYAPNGWALCNGQLLPINQNQALFSLLGTTYGGNGQTNFALPDLRGRVPLHTGDGLTLGQAGGETAHTLVIGEMPMHNHSLLADATTVGTTNTPGGSGTSVLGRSAGAITPSGTFSVSMYNTAGPGGTLNPAIISNNGGSQPHLNMQPYLTLNFSIALQGIFPSRN